MTASVLPRERGGVIRCNNGNRADGEDCTERHFTANVMIRVNRRAAAAVGWVRGGGMDVSGSDKRWDFCPTHAPAEAERTKVGKERTAEVKRAEKVAAKEASRVEREAKRAATKEARQRERDAKKAARIAAKVAAGRAPTASSQPVEGADA